MVAMGDSITEGFKASGFSKCAAPPYQPNYVQLVANTLEKRYGAPVTLAQAVDDADVARHVLATVLVKTRGATRQRVDDEQRWRRG